MLQLYKNIKSARLAAGLSQDQLAQMIGYTDRSSIAKIEAGKVDLPQSKIKIIADALRTTPAALMGWDDPDTVIISDTDPQLDRILTYANELNAQGLAKLGDYAEDLAGNPAYQK